MALLARPRPAPGRAGLILAGALLAVPAAAAVDLAPLWDFGDPAASEQRMRAALQGASGDDALILHTQIARTWSLRKDFDAARRILAQVEPQLAGAGPEARARHALELGRSHASAAHTAAQLTPQAREQARQAFQRALDTARAARLDALAVDAIHMFAFLDTAPADQLRWAQAAMAVVQASDQPDAKRWEASIRHNIGYALQQLGRHEEALSEFRRAVVLRERGTNARATRVAHWMVARTLRSLGRTEEALAIQLRLAQENDTAGQPDPHVFEELAALYRALGDAALADHHAARGRELAERARAASP